MDARGGEDVRANYIGERRQDCGASADIIGERGQRQIHVLARIGFTLAVERLVKREFSIKDHGQKARSRPAAGDHMKGRRRLADLLTRSAAKLLADMLDHFPLTWNDLECLGDVFAELGKPHRAAARATGRTRNDHALAREMVWERFARGLAACVRRNERGRVTGLSGGFLGCDFVFGGGGFEVFQLEFHLIEELAAALGSVAIELSPHLLDGKLEMGDQRFGARDVGHRTRGCGLGVRSLRFSIDARHSFGGQEPLETFQIVRQLVNRRHHGCK